jgi:hypothetical protein
MMTHAGSLFVGAGCLLLGVLVIDLLWDVKTIVEQPFTERDSEAVRQYYFNNLVDMAKKAPLVLAPFPLAFVVVVVSLVIELAQAVRMQDHAATMVAAISVGLTFPLIVLAAVSTIPLIAKVEAGQLSMPLEKRHRLQRIVFFQHVLYAVAMSAAVLLHILR